MTGNLETAFGHAVPEIEILGSLVVLQRHVANDAERDERGLVDMAGLRDRAALHVDGHRVGEVGQYLAHLLTRVDKPFAADGQAAANLYAVDHAAERQGLVDQRLWRHETGGLAHDLATRHLLTTIGVVVGTFSSHHHIERAKRHVGSACHARRHNEVGLVTIDHLHGANGRVYLSDATLLQNNLSAIEGAYDEVLEVMSLRTTIVEQRLELRGLLVHRNDNTNLFQYNK